MKDIKSIKEAQKQNCQLITGINTKQYMIKTSRIAGFNYVDLYPSHIYLFVYTAVFSAIYFFLTENTDVLCSHYLKSIQVDYFSITTHA